MWVIRTIIVIALIVVILGFSIYNAEERVAVNLLQTRYVNVPLIIVTYWAFIFGVIVSFILFVTIYYRQVTEIRRYKRAAEGLEAEISALRNRRLDEAADKFLQTGKGE